MIVRNHKTHPGSADFPRAAKTSLRRDAKTIFRAALEAAHAGNAVRAHLSVRGALLKAGQPSPLTVKRSTAFF